MKNKFAILITAICLLSAFALAAKPHVILGPGTGGAYFRVPYHQTWNRVLSADTVYILTAWYFVDSTYSLTIPAGTLIRGDSASGGTLIIKRGAQIFASGTASNPIVFTSNKTAGTRQPGDWGGVIILGKAPINQPNTTMIEGGFNTIAGAEAMYGGNDPNDNSGVCRYIRIEFAGIAFSQDNEINGFTFGGVGAGTTLDHIQVSYANDDDYEFFGGTVQGKYLVGWRSLDDCFDTDFGFSGKLQFLYTKRDPNIFDASAPGQSNGEESDNMGTAPYIAFPTTKARFSNWTLVGPASDTNAVINSHWGFTSMLRRATHLSIHNSIMMGWEQGINIRDTLTQRACLQDSLQLRHISLATPWGTSGTLIASSSPSTGNIAGFNPISWFNTSSYGNNGSAPRQLSAIGLPAALWNLDNTNNPVPPTSSEPATAGTGYNDAGNNLAGDAFYDSVSYRGAFDPTKPMSQQWTAGWTNFDPNNYDPEAVTTIATTIGTPWNMVAVSVVPNTYDANTLFPGKSGTMFAFNTTTQGYVAAPTLANGQGYWAKYTSSGSNSITGSTLSGSSVTVTQAGWVLLGSMTNPVNVSALIVVPSGAITGSAFRFNPVTQGYVSTTVINPGEAVWVRVNQACTITFP